MLTREENDLLTRTGPATRMGQLMRRYWIPALLSDELDERDGAPRRLTLLGEKLVAFRDTEGRVGLFDERCPHRNASMFFGRNEEHGLRCVYHGWKFDVTGQCVDMPEVLSGFEPPPTWIAFFGPAQLPKPVLDRIYGALVGALKDADLRDKVEATGVAVMLNTPEEFAALQKRDIASIGRVVKAAGIKPE